MAKSFSKKGLRRDLNFADLDNPTESLNNLLNGLVDVSGESFISEDLDAIKNIGASTMVNSDFRNIVDIAGRVTNESGTPIVYEPIIKLKNRFDIAEFTIGEPQFWGGDGLTTRFYEGNQIESTATDPEDIFTGTEIAKEIFWENGILNFETKLHQSFIDVYGGIEYTGYFRPTTSGIHTFGVYTTGFYTIEFDDGADGYELFGRKSQTEYSFTVAAASAGATSLVLQTPANTTFLFENDILINDSISQFEDPDSTGYDKAPVTITSVNSITGVIGLSAPLDESISAGTSFTFRFLFGQEEGRYGKMTRSLRAYETYKIRFRFWVPNESFVTRNAIKSIRYYVSIPGENQISTYLNYKWLYSEDYNLNPVTGTPSYGDFTSYYHNKLPLSGGTVGGSGSYDDYKSILSLDKVEITYQPPVSLTLAIKKAETYSIVSGLDYITSTLTDGAEVGNYIFATGINAGTRVNDIAINESIFLDANVTTTGSVLVNFVNHRGLVAFEAGATWTSGSTTISGLSTNTISKLSIGDVVIANGSPTYNTIASISTTSITVTKTLTASSSTEINATVLFYKSSGLQNNSLITYCTNVYSGVTTVLSSAGTNTITIDVATSIAPGQVVQYGSRIPANTTVVSITPSGADFVILLSANLLDDISSNQIITFAPAGTTDSKEICFPPIDTSPPFTATTLGLSTTSTRPVMELAPLTGTSELKFVGLSADNVTAETVTVNPTYNRTLQIIDGNGNTYKILGTTT